ncbi:MAG: hypothetical protein JWN44_5139 [Myxococcales bacterium]|nr:hypothetical protein [Myxococcales bacterium]
MRRPLVLLALFVAGCPGSLGDPARFTAACPNVPGELFVQRCATASCHSAAAKVAALDLESADVSARLVNVKASNGELLIDPINPDGSVLIRKLTASPPFGERQPPGAPLDPATIECVRSWARSAAKSAAPDMAMP